MSRLAIALVLLVVLAPAAAAQDGEAIELVANHPITEGPGTDLELHGDYAYVAFLGGLAIIDISDPSNPRRAGTLECGGGGHDIALSPDATIAYLAADDSLSECGEGSGTAIVDIVDKERPQVLSSVTTDVGSHTVTVDGHVLSSNNYASAEVLFFDVSDPRAPKPLATTETPGPSAFHDSFFDHRPDGKVLLYGASGEGHDVFDVTDPAKPAHLQRITDPEVSFSHQLEPNHKRDVIIASDEWMGGGTAVACGRVPGAAPLGAVPGPGAASDLGAYSFYRASGDGTFAGAGPGEKLGTFNIPFEAPQQSGCTSHVFWQAPDANRMIGGWYVRGVRIIDFEDPAAPEQIAWFEPDGGDVWAAKPHRGLIFTGDLARGMDVLRYTGPGWPATAGPAEKQRLAWHGFARQSPVAPANPAPAAPAPPPPTKGAGRVRAGAVVRVPGRRGRRVRLTISFIDAGAAVVGRASARKPGGRAARLRFTGVAEAGTYRFVVRAGRKVLKRGRFRVRPSRGARLPAGRVIVARAR